MTFARNSKSQHLPVAVFFLVACSAAAGCTNSPAIPAQAPSPAVTTAPQPAAPAVKELAVAEEPAPVEVAGPAAATSVTSPAPTPATTTPLDSAPARSSTGRSNETRVDDELLNAEISKDTYNALTELKSVLESQAWDDSARLVTSLDPQKVGGIAPYFGDKSLLVSVPVAVQLVLDDYSQVRQTIDDKLQSLAKLRVAQATAADDVPRVELATIQFAGDPAAMEAHRWLGDRALAAGRFVQALSHYEQAMPEGAASDGATEARRRLAAAMLGRDWGPRTTQDVQFGDVSMSAEAFESLISEMRSRDSMNSASRSKDWHVPRPGRYESHVRSRLDGAVGDRPQEEIGRRTNQLRAAWADRQIATVVDGDTLYVSNRFQVAAYRLATGERVWQSQKPPGQMQRAQEFTLIPMRPLIAGDRIFVRLLYSSNPILACFDKSSGKLLWVAESREREIIISDPLLIEGRLVAIGMALQSDQQGLLRHFTFDPGTGELLAQRDLIRMRSSWGTRSCCEVAAVENGMVAVLGGATIALDAEGTIRWARSQLALPADEDPRWVLQMFQRPLVHGNRLYVAQPGVRAVDCLAADTGRRHWSTILSEVVGLVGLAGDLLIVRTETDVRALEVHDGSVRWQHSADDIYSFQLLDDNHLLIACRERVADSADRRQIRLHWLNPSGGTSIATAVLPNLTDNDPRLGPIVPYQDRLFAFFGRGQHDATRDVVELVPVGEATSSQP